MRLTDVNIATTGGAQGIGRGIALRVASEGAHVMVADINKDGARSVADEIEAAGGRADAIHVDVTDRDSLANVVSTTASAFDLWM